MIIVKGDLAFQPGVHGKGQVIAIARIFTHFLH